MKHGTRHRAVNTSSAGLPSKVNGGSPDAPATAWVGRVGGLACALGIGAVVVSTYGLGHAWADPVDSDPSAPGTQRPGASAAGPSRPSSQFARGHRGSGGSGSPSTSVKPSTGRPTPVGDEPAADTAPAPAVRARFHASPQAIGSAGASSPAQLKESSLVTAVTVPGDTPETVANTSVPQQRKLNAPQPDLTPGAAGALTSPAAAAVVLAEPSAALATPAPAPIAATPGSGLLALANTVLFALELDSDGLSPRPDTPAHLPIQFMLSAWARRELDTEFAIPQALTTAPATPVATALAATVFESAAALLPAAATVVSPQTPQPAASTANQFSILPIWDNFQGVQTAVKAAGDWVQASFNATADRVQTAVNATADWARASVNAAADWVGTAVIATVDWVQTAVTATLDWVQSAVNSAITIGRNIVNAGTSWLFNLVGINGIEQPGELTPTAALYSVLRDLTDVENSNNFFLEPVLGADGTERLVVFLGGTEPGNADTGAWTNIPSWNGEVKDYQRDQVLELLNGDKNQPIMLVGYSQGGMDAQNLAEYLHGEHYNVQAVVAFGSPQILTPSPDYQTIFLKDPRDPVASLRQEDVSVPDSSVYERLASTQGSADPLGVHGNVQTYIDIGKKFDANPGYTDVKEIINKFTNGTAQVRVVLTWGSTPHDLDSHLTGPTSTTETDNRFHIFFSEKTFNLDSGVVAASLDLDDTTSYGPEVTTIRVKTPGDYYFYVNNYSRDSETGLAQSGATVAVYTGASAKVFTVNEASSGMYWSVCKLTVKANGDVTITPINVYSDSPVDGGVTSSV